MTQTETRPGSTCVPARGSAVRGRCARGVRWALLCVVGLLAAACDAGSLELAVPDAPPGFVALLEVPPQPGERPRAVGRVVDVAGAFVEVSAGFRHACGLRVDATIACWGHNTDSHTENRQGQLDAPPGRFSAVSAGGWHTCGLSADATTVACWGDNRFSQLDAPMGRHYTAISAGRTHTCALQFGGYVECWPPHTPWSQHIPPERFVAIDVGVGSSCGLRADGHITCWGVWGPEPSASGPPGRWDGLAVGADVVCGVRVGGTVACGPEGWTHPELFDSVSVGWHHACGVRSDGTAACWDWATDGPHRAETPAHGQDLAPPGRFEAVTAGGELSCGLRPDGTVTCWGNVEPHSPN